MNHGENFLKRDIGVNYRMQEVVACIAYHGLLELEERNKRRRDLASIVQHSNSFIPIGFRRMNNAGYLLPGCQDFSSHVFYVYPFTIHGNVPRDLFIKRMKAKGVYASGGYLTPPLHKFKAFKKYARGPLPVVEELSFKTLCLINDLTPDKPLSWAKYVAKSMKEFLR